MSARLSDTCVCVRTRPAAVVSAACGVFVLLHRPNVGISQADVAAGLVTTQQNKLTSARRLGATWLQPS